MIAYLFNNRERPRLLSLRLIVVWIKRVLTFGQLLKIIYYRGLLRIGGAKIGTLSVFDTLQISGKYSNLNVGDYSIVGKGAKLVLHGKISIGKNVVINDGVQLLTASHYVNDSNWRSYSAAIVIEDFAWVATNAMILPGVTIGKGAVVGAGAVVRKDVQPGAVVIGNPAVVVNSRSDRLNYFPVKLYAPYEAWLGKK